MSEGTKVFETLNNVNVNGHTEKKGNLTYLSWAWAWAEVKKAFPSAHYEIWKDDRNLPYVYDPEVGYMVYTKVAIMGQEHEMWLPVMDSHNRAMKTATMTDINKAIMRCLTKNLAMFGLGLYIYAGEDLPEEENKEKLEQEKKAAKPATAAMKKVIVAKCEEHGIDLMKWLGNNNVANIDALTTGQAVSMINTLKERFPDEA